jgi:hypothetical protein
VGDKGRTVSGSGWVKVKEGQVIFHCRSPLLPFYLEASTGCIRTPMRQEKQGQGETRGGEAQKGATSCTEVTPPSFSPQFLSQFSLLRACVSEGQVQGGPWHM